MTTLGVGSRVGTEHPSTSRGIVWKWKFYYEQHWRRHALLAIRGFHFLLYYHDAGREHDDVKELPVDRRGRPLHARKSRTPG